MCSNYPCNKIGCKNIIGCCQGIASFSSNDPSDKLNWESVYTTDGAYNYCLGCVLRAREEEDGDISDYLEDALQEEIVNYRLDYSKEEFNEYITKRMEKITKRIILLFDYKKENFSS